MAQEPGDGGYVQGPLGPTGFRPARNPMPNTKSLEWSGAEDIFL